MNCCCCAPYKKLSKSESQEHFELVQQLGFAVTYDDVHSEFEKLRLRQGRSLVFLCSYLNLLFGLPCLTLKLLDWYNDKLSVIRDTPDDPVADPRYNDKLSVIRLTSY